LRRLENQADDVKRLPDSPRECPELMALVDDVMGVTSVHRDGDSVTPGANGGGEIRLLDERKANDDRDA